MKKKGMELQVGFLVMLVLAIVIFGFGILFAARLFSTSREMVDSLPQVEESVLKGCINKGESAICISMNRKDIKVGSSDVFGVAVVNNIGQEKQFYVLFNISTAVNVTGGLIDLDGFNARSWTFDTYGPKNISNREYEIFVLPVQVPRGTQKGEYSFNVNVCFDDGNPATSTPLKCFDDAYPDLYESTHKIYINVK